MDYEILNALSHCVMVKDAHGKFEFANTAWCEYLESVGGSAANLTRKSDYDMPWRDQAEAFLHDDHLVLSGQPLQNKLEINCGSQVMVSKSTFTRKKQSKLVVCFSPISDLMVMDKNGYFQGERFYFQLGRYSEYLTLRELNVLQYLLLGKSGREIAEKLLISRRTVETHIEAIKGKLLCEYKSEIIEKAATHGLLYIMFFQLPGQLQQ